MHKTNARAASKDQNVRTFILNYVSCMMYYFYKGLGYGTCGGKVLLGRKYLRYFYFVNFATFPMMPYFSYTTTTTVSRSETPSLCNQFAKAVDRITKSLNW